MTAATGRIRPAIQALSAYAPPPADAAIKLDAMENPHPWPPPELAAAWGRALAAVAVNRYPDPHASDVTRRLRGHLGLRAEQGVLVGNGSDELIQLVTLALARPGATVLVPEPTFVMYQKIATLCGLHCVGVPLTTDFALDPAAMEAAIAEHDPALIWLAWPNNPTGNAWAVADVWRVVDAAPGLVVIDEAYQPFARASFIDQLGERDNLLVLRTLSKLGLAGLRLGFLAGPPAWLDEFDKLRLPYNINALTQAGAAFALDHFDALEQQAAAIRAAREELAAALAAQPGVTVYSSEANFLLLRVQSGWAGAVHQALGAAGIRIKCLHGHHPQLADCLRVTVGTPAENERLLQAMRAALAG